MIEVKSYSGHKGEERPRSLIIDGEEYLIEGILRREIVEDYWTKERKSIFWCFFGNRMFKVTLYPSGRWEAEEKKGGL